MSIALAVTGLLALLVLVLLVVSAWFWHYGDGLFTALRRPFQK